jgi:hypothetical protein
MSTGSIIVQGSFGGTTILQQGEWAQRERVEAAITKGTKLPIHVTFTVMK